MQSTAVVRGPINPFNIDADGESTLVSCRLIDLLERRGFTISDQRSEISPESFVNITELRAVNVS